MNRLVCLILLILSYPGVVSAEKSVYIPKDFGNDPALKTWSEDRWYQSKNFVVFWGPVVGEDPREAEDKNLRFDPAKITETLESIYSKFIDEIGFCSDDKNTNLGTYKIIIVMNDTWGEGGPTGWAFGSGYDDTIGAMWVHPNATRDGHVLSHELTHSLHLMTAIQENPHGGYMNYEPIGFFWECHANFMRLQMYPERAGEDLPRWMGTSMFHWSSTRHHYTSFHLLWHIQQLDGIEMINRLWAECLPREHPLITYRRLKGWDQPQLNDFIYDYAKREVTLDYPVNGFGKIARAELNRLAKDEPHYLWRRITILDEVDARQGHYRVPDVSSPQDYGFNLIRLHPSEEKVSVRFKGHTEVNDTAGWRYGLVAVERDGVTPRYGKFMGKPDGEVSINLERDDTALYLVVAGTPTEHTDYVWEPGWPKIKRYPYEVRMEGAVPEGYQPDFRAEYKKHGNPHSNGGGWVSDSAKVADSVYVGSRAIVRGNAVIEGDVKIDGTAWVDSARISGQVRIDGNANVWMGQYSDKAHLTDNAVLSHCTVKGQAIVKENAMLWGNTLEGDTVVGGDAEGINGSTGVYLQCSHHNNGRSESDGEGYDHPGNQDVNHSVESFDWRAMRFRRELR